MPEQWLTSPFSLRSVLGWLLLAAYLAVLLALLWRRRRQVSALSNRQWGVVFLLAVAGFGLSYQPRVAPAWDSVLGHALAIGTPQVYLLIFSAIPLFLAAAWFGVPAAMVVGFATGLGRVILTGDFLFSPFQLALAGGVVGLALGQSYRGLLFRVLRRPLLAGPILFFLMALPAAVATFSLVPGAISRLAALDAALGSFYLHALFLTLEGLLGGVAVWLIIYGELYTPPSAARPHPWFHSVRGRIGVYYGILAGMTLLLTLVAVPFLSVRVSQELVSQQMAQDARAVVATLPDFRALRENVLVQLSEEPALLEGAPDAWESLLAQSFRSGNFFRSLLLVDLAEFGVTAYPPGSDERLREVEQARLVEVRDTGLPTITSTQSGDGDDFILSFIVPVVDDAGAPVKALIGRVPYASLNNLVVGLDGLIGSGVGFIVDNQSQIIAHPNANMRHAKWEPPNGAGEATAQGKQVMDQDGASNTRRMLYYVREEGGSDWTVVAVVPFEVVLGLAVRIALPLLVAFGVVFGLAIPGVVALGRDVTAPLGELVDASRRMADGELDRAVALDREDEFGTLGQSFEKMRRSLKKTVSDMEFLVDATGDVHTGFDLEKTMPPILRNALRGTGAASVRAVLPNVRHEPYVRGEGPAADAVAILDRDIWRMAQHAPDKLLFLRNDGEIREHLPERLTTNLPIRAMAVLPLRYGGRYNGVLWLGYRQPHELGPIERTLLDILGGQAAANADNARLYVQAEGGRRRLAAVLSNIVDAVIVTDATDRVLLLNPAMERAFGLSQRDLKQPLERVIADETLREALLEGTERNRPVEVETPDGRLFAAQVSDIRGVDGRGMGRVALLRDITQAREMDQLRTHFLRELAHDLGSPLTTLGGYATMLELEGNLNETQTEQIDEIKKSIERVDFILSDLLEKERITDGRITRDMMSLADLLPEVVHHMEYETERKGLHLRMELGENLPEFAADRGMIRSALVNLIDNACKYAPHSGDLLLFAEREGDHVIIGLKDNGPGVEPGQQLAIFDSFYRPDSSRDANGTGLGLSLVRTVAHIHDGEAWCKSSPGEGSTFYISVSLQLTVTTDSDS